MVRIKLNDHAFHQHNASLPAHDHGRCVLYNDCFHACDDRGLNANAPAPPTIEKGRHQRYRLDTHDGEPSSNNRVFLSRSPLSETLGPSPRLVLSCPQTELLKIAL